MRICILLLGFVAGVALAQNPSLTVEQAMEWAIKNNPRLSAVARDVVAARSSLLAARALINPELIYVPALTEGGSDEELLFVQSLEINGSRTARTAAARARWQATQAEAVVQLRNLVFETKTAYYELVRAQELRALAQELLQIAEEFVRITRRQVEVGTRAGIDLTQMEIEAIRARQQLVLAEGQYTAALAALNTLMGRSPNEPVGTLPPLSVQLETIDGDAALHQALATRAEIALEEALREELLQEARSVRASGLPDLAVQVRAEKLRRRGGPALGIGLTLPLLDYGARRQRIRAIQEAIRAQSDRIAARRNDVRGEVERAVARLRAAEAVLKEYEQGILNKAKRLLEASRIGFQAGQTSIIALLEAQRTYRAVQAEYIHAQVNYKQARAELERATGAVPVPPPLGSSYTGGPTAREAGGDPQ